jgi:crotonobetainyl-CoA:carnitine CoA-transferase CaiB-like acyl-CoA transferase
MGTMTAALEGIRVIEAGLLVQGPQAAATLVEWGATCTKVELPGIGDQARWLPRSPTDSRSPYFMACNRGKRSVTLDLRRPPGREAFLKLTDAADVVITNFQPGTMESWGLGYEELASRNPGIVYAAGSTFGSIGIAGERAGADLSGQAAGGMIMTTGVDGGDPTPIACPVADHMAAQNLVSGILAALLARERTGRGQAVETSLLGGQIWAQAGEYTAYLMSGEGTGRANRGNSLVPGLYGIFRTADGWIAIVGVVGRARGVFYDLIGRPELSKRFREPLYFDQTRAELFPLIDEALSTRSTEEWCRLFSEAGLRFAPVRDHAQVVGDPSVRENGYLHDVDGETVVANPVRFSDTPGAPPVLPPELGQHTEEVLLELGYRWDDIDKLSSEGVI